MVNTTTEYKRALYTNPRFYGKAAIKLGSGQTINIQDTAQSTVFLPDGLKVDDSVSSSGNFDIGSAIINRLVMRLDNTAEAFSKYDFTGAVITAYVGLQLDGRIEWVKKGVFNADDPKAIASILSIEAMDNMTKFDKEYDRKITFPATLQTIIMHCCDRCGVPLVNSRFDNYNYVVKTNPFEENSSSLTYRQLLSYCAQIAGCFARCNADGHLELKWYDTSVFEGGSNMDGGTFDSGSPYATGDGLDGGNFINYASGDDFDGGTFLEQRDYHHIFALQSIEVSTDDIVVTAIRVTANSGKDDKDQTVDGETAQCGQDGYVLSISKNPLIECGRAGEVAAYLGGKMNGMKFRKMRASGLGDPAVEAGDCAIVTDRKGNSYHCYLTSVSYTTGSYETYETGAESPARNSSKRGEDSTTETVIARGEAEKVLSTYDKVVQQMTQLISAGFGMYLTPEKLDDGSTRYYMHDKPTKEESSYVCYLTSNGIMGSVDGGTTWAIDKNGNALYNVMTAIGVNAEWINAGKLVIRDKYGNETMFVDVETGAVRMVVDSFVLRGKTVEEIAIQANEEIINAVAGDLQAQVDGKIETYNQTSDPSTAWTTTAAKSAHKGDLWYSSNTKTTKRWTGTEWGTMAMEDTVAQDLAKSKRRIFVSTPVPPYDVGDLWVGNSASDMKRCQTARSSGSYYSSDWILATKYTDDTVANDALKKAGDAIDAAKTPIEYLSQVDVFNKLTNNGAMQGIYMSGGKLYVNASYIQGGILRLGGSNNGNGVLQVFDQYGTLKCQLDRVSLNINQGKIVMNMADGSVVMQDAVVSGTVNSNGGVFNYGRFNNVTIREGDMQITKPQVGYTDFTANGVELGIQMVLQQEGGGYAPYAASIYSNSSGVGGVRTYANAGTNNYAAFGGANMRATGTKNRVIGTDDYGNLLQYCYEMASPMFGDIGCGKTDASGVAVIDLDDRFVQTIEQGAEYYVFLQKEGAGDLWVEEKAEGYFAVRGTPSLKFAWEVKATQKDYRYERLDVLEVVDDENPDINYVAQAQEMMDAYYKAMENEFTEGM